MKALLDTHAFLWFVLNDARLSQQARAIIRDPANTILLSPVSYWEIAVKISLGRYTLPGPFDAFMQRHIQRNRLTILPIAVAHAGVVAGLPFHHKDPFDRLLVGQAMVEQVPLVSGDLALDNYAITRVW